MVVDEASVSVTQRIVTGDFVIEVVPLDAIDLIGKNSRFMRSETFRQLVANIAADGALSQIPFCVKVGQRFMTLSGNHRVKGAREAGLTTIPIIYTEKTLTREQQVAIQLSHNAIVGDDDPVVLLELWNELTVKTKAYAGLDDKVMAQLAAVQMPEISEVRLDFRALSFLFLPEEVEQVKQTFDDARHMVMGSSVYLARMQAFDALLDALATAKASYNIVNAATGLQVVLEVFRKHQDDLADGWWDAEAEAVKAGHEKQWVPVASIVGTDTIPADAAAVIKKAVDRMRDAGDVQRGSLWKALEYWAAESLAGAAVDGK